MSLRNLIGCISLLALALALAGCATTTSAPAPVAAAAKPHSATVTWDASKSKVSGYNVYRIIDPAIKPKLLTTTKPDVTRYEDTEVEPGKTYTYSVRSLSLNGKIESVPAIVTVTIPTN